MARARNIKPGFFKSYELADAGPLVQLLFAGLWCMADREGRMEDKPRFIKAELFPYYDFDVNGGLTELARLGFVERYEVDGIAVVQVCNFKKHQTPHITEKASSLPARQEQSPGNPHGIRTSVNKHAITVDSRKSNDGKTPDSLIPDSLIPDSLIPDSLKDKRGGDTPAQARATNLDIPAELLADWMKVRKAKKAGPVTATVIAGLTREAAKAGLSITEAVATCCEASWQGFRADWYAKRIASVARSPPVETFAERDARNGRQRWSAMTGEAWPDEGVPRAASRVIEIIDITENTRKIA